MTEALQLYSAATPPVSNRRRQLVPWRDPHTVPAEELTRHIAALEAACVENPDSADLRTCLGMAYAMNLDAYKSMDVLEAAVRLEPENYFAQLKYAELLYRLRALPRAEEETLKALELAGNSRELALARAQLQEIRRLWRDGTQKPAWTKPLLQPTLLLMAMCVILFLVVVLR
ncbi:MAG TPA: hypothetical protein VIL39_01950 [Verrucomicrobiae bacterium]|jgi:tetratricopeptide (TPR) repeat protein